MSLDLIEDIMESNEFLCEEQKKETLIKLLHEICETYLMEKIKALEPVAWANKDKSKIMKDSDKKFTIEIGGKFCLGIAGAFNIPLYDLTDAHLK